MIAADYRLPVWRCAGVDRKTGERCERTYFAERRVETELEYVGGQPLCPGCRLRRRLELAGRRRRAGRRPVAASDLGAGVMDDRDSDTEDRQLHDEGGDA